MGNVDLRKLHTNQRLFVKELLSRGATVSVVDYDLELLEVTFNGKREYLLDRTNGKTAYMPSILVADKHLTKQLLRERGITVPDGKIFLPGAINDALAYADEVDFPLVVKPNLGSHGYLVYSGIQNHAQLESALLSFLHHSDGKDHFLVERHIPGNEYRIFITTKGDYAVLLREPASVVGDGKRSIRELAREETLQRKAAKKSGDSVLCPIALDQVALDHLRRQGLNFESVPRRGQKVPLRLSSNIAQGGISRDMTDRAHPDAIGIAKQILKIFDGLPCVGVDFLTADIEKKPAPGKYAILEVNANPGIAMHHMPAFGKPRNVASYLADAIFG